MKKYKVELFLETSPNNWERELTICKVDHFAWDSSMAWAEDYADKYKSNFMVKICDADDGTVLQQADTSTGKIFNFGEEKGMKASGYGIGVEKETEYYKVMLERAREWWDAKNEMEHEVDDLFEENKYDESNEVREKFEKENPYPLTNGQDTALKAYIINERKWQDGEFKELFVIDYNNAPVAEDMKNNDYLKTLKKCGIDKLLVIDRSTDLMDVLFLLRENGCKLEGLKTYETKRNSFNHMNDVVVKGIEFSF